MAANNRHSDESVDVTEYGAVTTLCRLRSAPYPPTLAVSTYVCLPTRFAARLEGDAVRPAKLACSAPLCSALLCCH
jgi:hypothetical protein